MTTDTPALQPHQIFWEDAKPEDFMNAQLMDWIQYVGDISTQYELNFIRNFGGFWSAHLPHTSPPAPSCQTCVDEMAIFCQGCPNLIAHLNGELKKSVNVHDEAIRTAAAKATREDVLKELTEKFSELRHDGWNLWKGQEAIDELLDKQTAPCEENGCTDIENCDEICEHMRIYSPAYVREKVKAAKEKVLKEACEQCPMQDETPDTCENCLIHKICSPKKSLRQPEPQP